MFAFYNSFDAEKAGIMLVKFIFHVEKKARHQKKDAHDSIQSLRYVFTYHVVTQIVTAH
jgi:hypothetical protein